MGRPSEYPRELRERAVRVEHVHEHPSHWATIQSVEEKLDCTNEALRRWVRQAEALLPCPVRYQPWAAVPKKNPPKRAFEVLPNQWDRPVSNR